MAKQNILNDNTTWGAEATKIEANFDELYNNKVDKTSVVQTTGASLSDVMSQKAVTDELAQLAGSLSFYAKNGGSSKSLKDLEDTILDVYELGSSFKPDADGTLAERSLYDGELTPFSYLDNENGILYFKKSDMNADWSLGKDFSKGADGDVYIPVFSNTLNEL